jgi:hypothetical protein
MERRPRSKVQAVTVCNDQNVAFDWIPLRLEVNSWVILKAVPTGAWARDARAHGEESFAGAWKAQIKDFRWIPNAGRNGGMKLEAILVRHAYHRRQIVLDPEGEHANEPRLPHFLYASYWEDWVHPTSILDHILVLHHEVGEATRNGRSPRDLMENGTFYLRAVYVPPARGQLYGELEPIPLPDLDDPEWPVPDMHTSEAFRTKFAADIGAAMKATTGSKVAHVQWFLPIHVMVDMFHRADSIRRTATMFNFGSPSDILLKSLMDPGWEEKHHIGQDVIKCVVTKNSMRFRYHIGRQTLYGNFQYIRHRLTANRVWEPLDQEVVEHMAVVTILYGDTVLPAFEVGSAWPVSHLRHEIAIALGGEVPEEYNLFVEEEGKPSSKVCFYFLEFLLINVDNLFYGRMHLNKD